MQGRSDEAQAAYEAGLRAAPDDPDLLTNIALSKALTGAYGDAIRTLRDVNASGRADRRHRHALVLVLALSGDETGARAEGRSLRIPDPEVDEVLQVARTAAAEADPRRRAALIGVAPG
jgi:Flp pilus assembly protein TadD